MVKRRRTREHDEADAREQAERRRDALIADLKARLGSGSQVESHLPTETPDPAADDPETDAAEPEPG